MFWIVSLLKLNQSEVSLKVCLLPAANNFLLAYGARKNRFLDNGNESHSGWKVSKYGVFSGLNAGKYGPEKTPYLFTFHAVSY